MTRWTDPGRRPAGAFLAVAVILTAAAGCGDDGGDDGTADTVDAAPSDTEAPELRDLRVTIEGDLGVTLELNTRDAQHIIPAPGTAEFVVLARDDSSPAEALSVEVIDATEAARAPLESELRNGLWRVRIDVAPGDQLRVRVADQAGNTVESQHVLQVPALEQALAGAWEAWFFDDTQTVTHIWLADWSAGGTWTETREDSGYVSAGTWALDGLTLERAARTSTGPDPDADDTTIEWRRDGDFYVDGTYFAPDPYVRTAGSSGVEGTWERSRERWEPDQGGLVLAEEVSETITFDISTWNETRTVIDHRGASPATTITTRAGDYRIELNDNYTEAIGNFLVRTVTELDGTTVAGEPETWELHVTRLGRLLVSPMLRQ